MLDVEGDSEVSTQPSFRCGSPNPERWRPRIRKRILHLRRPTYSVGGERSRKVLFLKYPPVQSWMIFVVRTGTYRMFFQQKLFIWGGRCSRGRDRLSSGEADPEDKHHIRVITATSRSQAMLTLSPSETSRTPCLQSARSKEHGAWTQLHPTPELTGQQGSRHFQGVISSCR